MAGIFAAQSATASTTAHDQCSSSSATAVGTTPFTLSTLQTARSTKALERNAIPLSATPQREIAKRFDVIAALWDARVPHVVLLILSFLNLELLTVVEHVSTLWRDIVKELPVRKQLMLRKVETCVLWRGLFERRKWSRYLSKEAIPSQFISTDFYRQLYQSASRDLYSLNANWRRGCYTLTKIKSGSPVNCLQLDPERIVSGHDDHTIRIWDRWTVELTNTLLGHTKRVCCLQCDVSVIISGSLDHTVKVWDIQTGQMVNNLLHHSRGVWSLKFNSDTLITGSEDQTVAVWDFLSPTTITLRTVVKGLNGAVLALDLTDTKIISGAGYCNYYPIKIWDSSTGVLISALKGHTEAVQCIQCKGSLIISNSFRTIRIWNIDTGECLRTLNIDTYCTVFDGMRIVTGSYKAIKVYSLLTALDSNVSNDALYTTLKEHTDCVRGVQFDDFQLISCATDNTILIYDFLEPTPIN